MISDKSSVLELTDVLYKSINKAHDQVKTLGTKSFYTFKDAVLIFNAKRVLSGEVEESNTIQECNTKEKCLNILEQSLNIAHVRGSFSLEDCVILNSVVALLKTKLNEEQVSRPEQQEVSTQTEEVVNVLEEESSKVEVVEESDDDDYTITLNKK
jgi:hypothetical protein